VGVARQQHMITVQWFHVVTRVTTISTKRVRLQQFEFHLLICSHWVAQMHKTAAHGSRNHIMSSLTVQNTIPI